ncbi:zinc transporter ZIP1-like [Tachypleus tridentatus]|uniref:zinc transporter ZIP1-like n=1 Tax=Tachypleus tridentatus TaxID=6853 RepID=UPI003FD2E633
MLLIVSRILTLIFLFFGTFICGTFPLLISRCLKSTLICEEATKSRITPLLLNFGGGVLISVTFLHLLPEVRYSFESYWGSDYNDGICVAELVVCAGFFTVYLLEEVIHTLITRVKQPTVNRRFLQCDESESPTALECTLSDKKLERQSLQEGLLKSDSIKNYGSLDLEYQLTNMSSSTQSAAFYHRVSFRSFVMVAALSFHSVFEGLAVGLQPTVQDTWSLFFAEAIHKFIIAFALGLEMHKKGETLRKITSYMIIFSLMTPFGTCIAMLTDQSFPENSQIVIGSFNGVACGTLMYITFFEVLQRSQRPLLPGLLQALAVFVGFGLMSSVRYFLLK